MLFNALFISIGTFPNMRQLNSGLKAAGSIITVIDRTPKIILDDPKGESIDGIHSDIEFLNVSHQYSLKNPLVLDNITFSFQRCKTTAIVGESG